MIEESDIVELPAIPSDAPEWVRNLPSYGRFVDRTKVYDITGHLLFDSLLNSNGIRHFFFFMGIDKDVEQVTQATKILSVNPSTSDTRSNENTEVRAAFHLGEGICGHKGIVHGGLTATMIDEVSGAAAFSCIGPSFTANLNITYLRPLFTPVWVLVRAHIERIEGRKAYTYCSVEDGNGGIYAKGLSLFISPKVPEIQQNEK